MNVAILYRRPMRRWQMRLAEALRADGHRVAFVAGQVGKAPTFWLAAALRVQQQLFGPSPSQFDVVGRGDDPVDEFVPDLLIALDGEVTSAKPRLEAMFDDEPGDAALIRALTHGGSPTFLVRLTTAAGATDVVSALLAVEDRDILSRAIDQTLLRVGTLLVQAVRRYGRDTKPSRPTVVAKSHVPRSPLAHIARGIVARLVGQSLRDRRRSDHWRVAYRHVAVPSLLDSGWTNQPFATLADDERRFYADPMPIAHNGRDYIFFEEYPYATGKGEISVVTIDSDGSASLPRTVLDQPVHLSYPFVVKHDHQFYMLPEMGAARRVQLFRAEPFPDRWVADRILIEDCVAADATPILYKERWWLFTTLSNDGGSTWDQLCLFHAPDLFGPWVPHADNPVLVDASAARPAGAMWEEDGVLMRIVQDCRTGYGRGIAICRVDRLDAEGYEQTILRRLTAPNGSGADGIHTFNRVGTLEVIDLRYPSS